MSNELTTNVQRENENYVIIKDENGKFSRKAKFQSLSTIVAESREDKIWLMNLLEGAEGTGNGLKEHVG
jgi:DNA/RNA-binding domain of Phe-tRNA-synthetase-like protein